MFMPNNKPKEMTIEANPKPPSRIKRAMTVRPNNEKVSATSTVTNPVTQTALVEIKRASI
jgi:hypothetical protein